MQEFKSPTSGKVYKIHDVSPVTLRLLTAEQTETKESTQLREQIATLASNMKFDKDMLDRQDVKAELKGELEQRVINASHEIERLHFKLIAITKVTPKTMCEILRTFVDGLENKNDIEILRLGKDLDYLYMIINRDAEQDADQYAKQIDFFRTKSSKGGGNRAKG